MARSLNKVMLIGNLGRDPELKSTPSGQSVATFSMATNRRYKNKEGEWQDETQWHNIVAWGNRAETIATYLKKGSKIYVEGRLTHRSWEDQEGQKKYMTEVVLEYFAYLDPIPEGAKGAGQREPVPPPPQDTPESAAPDGEDDVPF
ncbi:single-stranded DNA-binding protein [candidate division LCP-89 bacterium B3_LCP]|uniref:Single-stranded DNA-binding protein n=1 Tax=candidate division LCP-89 bacterium B3_LCP TaxID=2012998 RepID=A0A532V382_UNCL8|nr:MAG: single-stranded DNA-binding protein [candidate division LCP-89 bacterium B3_LCP]